MSLETGFFYGLTNIHVKLVQQFYSDPTVVDNFCNMIKEDNCYVSSTIYDPKTNSISVQFRKAFFKKVNNPNDSMEFYSVFYNTFQRLIEYYTDLINAIFDCNDEVMDMIKRYTNMLYNITRVSTNTVIINL